MVNGSVIEKLAGEGLIPVITPIAVSSEGSRLNINADYAAAAVAKALEAERCLFVTNVDGILIEGTLVAEASVSDIKTYISKGDIYGGMIPKVESAVSILEKGIDKVMIVSGTKAFYQDGAWSGTSIIGEAGVLQ
jgi:acetylglutamate kinase